MKAIKYSLMTLAILVFVGAIAWFGFLRPEPPLISQEDRTQISLMPLPAKLELGGEKFLIDSDLNYKAEKQTTPRMEKALERFFSRMKSQTGFSTHSTGTKK